MGEGGAKNKDKNCERCHKMRSGVPKHQRDLLFPLDCENCYINVCQPIEDNEIILELYEQLPFVFDGMTGVRIISGADIRFVLEIFDISRDFWDDFYQRIMYYNNVITETELKMQKKEADKKKSLTNQVGRRRVTEIKQS